MNASDPVVVPWTRQLATVPNLISIMRLGCIPLFVVLLVGHDDRVAAAWLLAGLGATDWVDGWVARRFDQVSEIGKILDPTADRLMFLVAVAAMIVDGSVPAWFALATLAREVAISITAVVLGAMGARRIDVTRLGKTSTFGLMVTYPLLLVGAADVGAADLWRGMGWGVGVPALALHWWAAWGYVGPAREAFAAGRAVER